MKRLAAGFLWTLVVMWIGSYVALFAGLPTIGVVPIGLLAGVIVVGDPRSWIWAPAIEQPKALQPSRPTHSEPARS